MLIIRRRFSDVIVVETEICPTLESASGAGGGQSSDGNGK